MLFHTVQQDFWTQGYLFIANSNALQNRQLMAKWTNKNALYVDADN